MKSQFTFSPWWLTGFTQADGGFIVVFRKRKDYKVGYQITPVFMLTQSNIESEIIMALQKHLNAGYIKFDRDNVILEVTSIQELLEVIIPHFDKYPLQGRKVCFLCYFS